ncbi:MAG TPA: YfhH family protein [Pseudogracilibacillus sp.]|nr:YfhH family protein [Pseudogracilibacillus sp.]
MSRYSDLTTEQLRVEIEKCKKEAQKAEQLGNISEVAINERKVQILLSYMAYPEDYKPGEIYEIRLDPGYTFKVNYIDGVMAWGHRVNLLKETLEKEEALPISMLGDQVKDK